MQFEVIANARTLQGTGASRRLRRAGTVPGIVYGGEAAPVAIETNHNDLLLKMKKEAFYSSVINMVIDGKKEQVLLRDYQTRSTPVFLVHPWQGALPRRTQARADYLLGWFERSRRALDGLSA